MKDSGGKPTGPGHAELISNLEAHRAAVERRQPGGDPLLVTGALAKLPPGKEIDQSDDWAYDLLKSPSNQPTFGGGTWGLKPLMTEYGEQLRSTLEGLVRELKGNLALPRLALYRDGYFELQAARLLDPDTEESKKALHPAFLVSCLRGFFGAATDLWRHYDAAHGVLCFVSLLNTQGSHLWSEWPMRDRRGMSGGPYLEPCPDEYPHIKVPAETVSRDDSPDDITKRFLGHIYHAYGFRTAPDFTTWK
jgi:hypothetical protein